MKAFYGPTLLTPWKKLIKSIELPPLRAVNLKVFFFRESGCFSLALATHMYPSGLE